MMAGFKYGDFNAHLFQMPPYGDQGVVDEGEMSMYRRQTGEDILCTTDPWCYMYMN